jgi:hypothetical protein
MKWEKKDRLRHAFRLGNRKRAKVKKREKGKDIFRPNKLWIREQG